MTRTTAWLRNRAILLVVLALSALGALVLSPAGPAGAATVRPSCNRPGPGEVACMSSWVSLQPAAGGSFTSATTPITGLTPANLRAAYGLPKKGGRGITIGIVVSNDHPKVEKDLAVYRRTFHLPACTTANKCFRKVDQHGGRHYPDPDAGWATETALDVQSVSAVCPQCHILLVEADYPEPDYLSQAVATAVRLGADVVSNSYGIPEFPGMLKLARKYLTHPGVPILAASGDTGYTTVPFPAALPGVWAIGGTTLSHTRAGGWSETAWRHGGSGCSAYAPSVSGRQEPDCAKRTTADISSVADAHQKFAVYDTYGLGVDNGWIGLIGTSLSTPVVAGMMGLAGHPAKVADPAYAYRHPSAYTDIVTGANGYCESMLCQAGPGYDAPTGLGSPHRLRGL
jgi:subtilase family serine protease